MHCATIRVTTHDDAATRVVRYSALRPHDQAVASHRPEHMHSVMTRGDVEVDKLVFFSSETSPHVLGGTVQYVDSDTCAFTVYEHRQAAKSTCRFTPLYTDTSTRAHCVEPRVEPKPCHASMHNVVPGDVHAVGIITAFYLPQSMLDSLHAIRRVGISIGHVSIVANPRAGWSPWLFTPNKAFFHTQ